jgi:hypothetical protein
MRFHQIFVLAMILIVSNQICRAQGSPKRENVSAAPPLARAQMKPQAKPAGTEPAPEPAVLAILAAFDKYAVVGMPEGHGMKDQDDFILSLIRNPAFSEKVNDIEVECGNSLYQSILDQYIAGEDLPFTEVQKVWRNTTQTTCGTWQFFDEFFPLVRAVNQKLRPERRLRVLAGDPPIDWNQVKGPDDFVKFGDATPRLPQSWRKKSSRSIARLSCSSGLFTFFMGFAAPCPRTRKTIQTLRSLSATSACLTRTRLSCPAVRLRIGRSRR